MDVYMYMYIDTGIYAGFTSYLLSVSGSAKARSSRPGRAVVFLCCVLVCGFQHWRCARSIVCA